MSWIDQGRQEHGWFGHGRAPERLRLAQAGLPGTATDTPAPAPSGARYIAADPERWIGLASVGDGECVALVKKAIPGLPRTVDWKAGRFVKGDFSIPAGALIATFDESGKYTGHAALYKGQDAEKLHVIDQWNVRDPKTGEIIGKRSPGPHEIDFNQPGKRMINRGESYRVVE